MCLSVLVPFIIPNGIFIPAYFSIWLFGVWNTDELAYLPVETTSCLFLSAAVYVTVTGTICSSVLGLSGFPSNQLIMQWRHNCSCLGRIQTSLLTEVFLFGDTIFLSAPIAMYYCSENEILSPASGAIVILEHCLECWSMRIAGSHRIEPVTLYIMSDPVASLQHASPILWPALVLSLKKRLVQVLKPSSLMPTFSQTLPL